VELERWWEWKRWCNCIVSVGNSAWSRPNHTMQCRYNGTSHDRVPILKGKGFYRLTAIACILCTGPHTGIHSCSSAHLPPSFFNPLTGVSNVPWLDNWGLIAFENITERWTVRHCWSSRDYVFVYTWRCESKTGCLVASVAISCYLWSSEHQRLSTTWIEAVRRKARVRRLAWSL